jgi:hypothetical protein
MRSGRASVVAAAIAAVVLGWTGVAAGGVSAASARRPVSVVSHVSYRLQCTTCWTSPNE